MTGAPPAIRVDRARLVRERPGDRERLRHALDFVSPAATGVPERALLLIPRMRVERPLGYGVESFANELIDRIRAAKVAARSGMPAAGQGVYFEDEIALEIAIVRVWLAGTPLPEAVREIVPLAAAPVSRWRRHLLHDHRKTPRLIAALVEANLATAWLARFADPELVAAADGLVSAYGGVPPRPAPRARQHSDVAPTGAGARKKRVPRLPIVMQEVVRTARTLAPHTGARRFMATAMLAARQPALVATRAFAAALADLRSDADTPLVSRRGSPDRHRVSNPMLEPEPSAAAARTLVAPVRPMPAAPAISIGSAVAPQPVRHGAAVPPPHPSRGALPQHAASPPLLPGEARVTASEHAGLFFVLNTFLALGLYGDFTDPVRGIRGLSPFELLLLLGRRWIGPRFVADPIAPLLRMLAGIGPRARPGRYFDAPAWQVPTDWLAPWPPGHVRTIRRRFGTSRWHPAGFPVADRWRAPRSAAWLRRRWVTCLARYIEARLMRALGVDAKQEALSTLLARPGTIGVDDERVEVTFALDAHPLAIRIAGLDRDPGWVPAAGRSIGFRFT